MPKIKGLYVITSENKEKGINHLDVAKASVSAGCKLIQYRQKNKSFAEKLGEALAIKKICHKYQATFIVNDSIDLALQCEADGVHLGQDDVPIEEAFIKLEDKVIGLSATNYNEALDAQKKGAHYIGVGPIFKTPSKADAAEPIGLENLKKIRQVITVPIVAIGGITIDNAASVYKAGADSIAVISAVSLSKDMEKAAKNLVETRPNGN